jgi:SPP1 family predicted phage head-tail adaptor
VQAGKLRKRLVLQSRAAGLDSVGSPSNVWTDVATVWGELLPMSGRALLAAQAVKSELTHEITLRYRAEFANPITAAEMRVVYGGRYFNIHAVLNKDERNRELTLMASEGLNNGD